MPYVVTLKVSASRQFSKLPEDMQRRISKALDALGDNPRPPGCKRLTNKSKWRVRVGDYRIIYEIQDAVLVVLVVEIAHRREVYR
jgi:mRNA interferase RelE/StbE